MAFSSIQEMNLAVLGLSFDEECGMCSETNERKGPERTDTATSTTVDFAPVRALIV